MSSLGRAVPFSDVLYIYVPASDSADVIEARPSHVDHCPAQHVSVLRGKSEWQIRADWKREQEEINGEKKLQDDFFVPKT